MQYLWFLLTDFNSFLSPLQRVLASEGWREAWRPQGASSYYVTHSRHVVMKCYVYVVLSLDIYKLLMYLLLLLYQQQALLGNCDVLFMTLPHEQIREFHKQWYLLTDCALEVFLTTGKTCLLAFNSTKVSQNIYMLCRKINCHFNFCNIFGSC